MRDLAEEDPKPLMATRPPARRRRRRPVLVAIALAVAAVPGLLGGVRYGLPGEAAPHAVLAAPFDVTIKGPGMLAAERHAVLGATVQGRIAALPVDVGDRVTAGAPVARLEDAEARIELAQAIEQARALSHQVTEAEAQHRREQATFRRFERELSRQIELRGRGIVAEGALDIARADREAAEARVAEAAARIERLEADLAGAERLVDRRREAVAQTVVTAPFDGIVIARDREVGDVVTPGAAILEMVDPATLILGVRLDESQMARIAPGQQAAVIFDSDPARRHPAAVRRIGREVDPETREFTVELALGSLPRNWAIGQRGSAAITVARDADALALPTALVHWRGGAAGTWILEDGRAHWRPLELGASSDGRVAVLGGLGSGVTVLDGPKLYEGMLVEFQP